MFSEPLTVTYDGVAKSFRRTSYGSSVTSDPATFVTADGAFTVSISQTPRGSSVRSEIKLTRTEQDADGNPFTGSWSALPNSVAFVYEVNSLRHNSQVDIPLIQAALTLLVDDSFRNRLIGGES